MTLLNVTTRNILHQGEYDGACFLYTVANAMVALTGEKPRDPDWDDAVLALPAPRFFLCGHGGGTPANITHTPLDLGNAIRTVLEKFRQPGITLTPRPEIDRLEAVGELISSTSVVILCYEGCTDTLCDMHHWVVAVGYDADPQVLHLACSARLSESTARPDDPYLEQLHDQTGLASNDSVSNPDGFVIERGTVFQLSIEA